MNETRKHPLRGLLVAQFCGAFNDNAWKLIVALMAMKAFATEAEKQWQTTLAFVALVLPMLLFSLPAGALADRVSKRSVILAAKALEIVLMIAAALTLLRFDLADPAGATGRMVALAVLGLMGVQSALFGPAKYGILPEILPHERLSAGNGVLEMWNMIAIVAGTAAAGGLLDAMGARVWLVGVALTILAVTGFAAAFAVPQVAPARAAGGLIYTVRSAWTAIRQDRVLWLTVLGLTFYWVAATVVGQDILVYAKTPTGDGGLGLEDKWAALPLAAVGLGVGVGALLAGRLSASKVEYGLIPLGATGLAFFTLLLGVGKPEFVWTTIFMACLGVSSGLLLVPLHALLQWRSPEDRRGAVIALSNFFVYAGIIAGSLSVPALKQLGLNELQILIVVACGLIAGTVWALWLMPDAFLRLLFILLVRTFYRLNVIGRQHVPEKGGALLVSNHVSLADGFFIVGSIDRPVRFIVESSYYERRLLRPFFKALGAIPISSGGGLRVVLRALRDAGQFLDDGDLVGIFAEGQMTRTGAMLPFRRGLERIVKGRDIPIIPVHLDRVWGSIFSRSGGRYITKIPQRIPYHITVSFGEPLSSKTSVHDVRQAVQELGERAWAERKRHSEPLHRIFIRQTRRQPWRLAFADAARPKMSRVSVLVGTIVLARALRRHWAGQEHVGVLLPPSIAGGLVNFAASLAGRTSVNLNYTAGRAGMTSAARQAGLRTVVTSRKFIEKASLELPDDVEAVWIEDVAAGIGTARKLMAFPLALLAPKWLLERWCGARRRARMDDIATVIFSSGSTGEPKGVQLSHFNIAANVEGAGQVLRFTPDDRMLGILPLFHSFGYMSLWCATNLGLGIVFHPNPLDAPAIGELIHQHRVTILLATPTFLQLYLRRCQPGQFGSLRIVVAGAEKLSPRLAKSFEDHFGIRLLEGYGTTECAPVVAASAPDFRTAGFFQSGSRRGFVGQPLPGVAVRVVDPETYTRLPVNTPGMILVKGPNVMQGYLGRDDLTADAMRDGWYVTGDIGLVDEDGFLEITDRLSRFSKIAGEMVPHGRVEEALHEAAGAAVQTFAVTAVPDEKKGERLAVLHITDQAAIPGLLDQLVERGLPNLFIPRPDQFVKVDALPLLGTGKLDLREVRRVAAAALGA